MSNSILVNKTTHKQFTETILKEIKREFQDLKKLSTNGARRLFNQNGNGQNSENITGYSSPMDEPKYFKGLQVW